MSAWVRSAGTDRWQWPPHRRPVTKCSPSWRRPTSATRCSRTVWWAPWGCRPSAWPRPEAWASWRPPNSNRNTPTTPTTPTPASCTSHPRLLDTTPPTTMAPPWPLSTDTPHWPIIVAIRPLSRTLKPRPPPALWLIQLSFIFFYYSIINLFVCLFVFQLSLLSVSADWSVTAAPLVNECPYVSFIILGRYIEVI